MKKAKIAIRVLAFVVFGVLLFAALKPSSPPAVLLPNPNGYDDFKQAALLVTADYSWQTQEVAQLRLLVEQNAKALELIRSGLNKECRVPLVYSDTYVTTNLLAFFAGFKRAAFAFEAEGKLAEKEGRPNDAARSYLDCTRFGEELAMGGLIIDKLVGIACQAMGMQQLRRCLPNLSSADLRQLLEALGPIDRNHEPPDSFLQRDKVWSRHAYPGWRGVWGRIQVWGLWKAFMKDPTKFLVRCHRTEAEIRLLRVDVALKLYRAEHGVYPAKLTELAPKYLDEMPIDPFTGKPLIYRSQTNSYFLYSIGPDAKDDGGIPLTRSSNEKGDLVSTLLP